MPDRYGRPNRAELRSATLFNLTRFVPVGDGPVPWGLAMQLRIARGQGAEVVDIARVLELDCARAQTLIDEAEAS